MYMYNDNNCFYFSISVPVQMVHGAAWTRSHAYLRYHAQRTKYSLKTQQSVRHPVKHTQWSVKLVTCTQVVAVLQT